MTDEERLWSTVAPASWPAAPADMTVSALRDIEACPRRWALSAASYPTIWSGRGYPPRLHLASLDGIVVHSVIETITRALVGAGCPSVNDASAVQAMRDLGGFTRIITDCIERVLGRHGENPRAAPSLGYAGRVLRDRVAQIRTRAQVLLGRVRLVPAAAVRSKLSTGGAGRRLLGSGCYTEIELRAEDLRWKGKVDLLVLTTTSCEIVDFKAGLPDESHEFQLRIYALLWSRDAALNPLGRLATRLAVAYVSQDEELDPPSAEALEILAREALDRARAARAAATEQPPQARPSPEMCRSCSVRHMCHEYWSPTTHRDVTAVQSEAEHPFVDAEVVIGRRHGATSWDATVTVCRDRSAGAPVLLRASKELPLCPGHRIRILDARLVAEEDGEAAVITMATLSETYVVSGPT